MKKTVTFILVLFALFGQAQRKVVSITPTGQQKVIDLDTVYQTRFVNYFVGEETNMALININNPKYVMKIWLDPDTIMAKPNVTSKVLFVYNDTLGTGTVNTWKLVETNSGTIYNPTEVQLAKTDSSIIVVGGVNYREYIYYTAPMVIMLGQKNSAGIYRKVFYNRNYRLGIPVVWTEKKRWKKAI